MFQLQVPTSPLAFGLDVASALIVTPPNGRRTD
jgi:hypothetical protein